MALRIIFHGDPSTPYVVDSTVSGHIELNVKNATQKDSISQINLYVSCRSKIRITKVTGAGNNRRTHFFRSKAVLFSHSYVLENKDFQIASSRRGEDGGVLNFPFEFTIPTHAEGLPPEKLQLHSADTFPAEGPWPGTAAYYDHTTLSQPLPDSLPDFHYIGTGARISLDGSITYKVRAEVPNLNAGWQALWIGNKDEDVYLRVVNPSAGPNALAQVQWHSLSFADQVRTLRLLPSHADGHLTFRERTRSVFKKSALPSLGLKFTFSSPQTLFLDSPDDDPLPFFLAIARTTSNAGDGINQNTVGLNEKGGISRSGDEYNIPTPKVFLTRMRVTLVAHTQIRTNPQSRRYMDPGSASSYNEHEIFEYRYKERESERQIELPLIDPSSSGGTGAADGQVAQQWPIGSSLSVNHSMLKNLGAAVVPDFATPNLARSYLLQWEVRVNVCGEEIKWESEKEEGGLWVRVERRGGLSAYLGASVGTGLEAGMGGLSLGAGAGVGVGGEEVLPAYEGGGSSSDYRDVDDRWRVVERDKA